MVRTRGRHLGGSAPLLSTVGREHLQLAMLQMVCLQTFADHLSAIGNKFSKASELRVLVNALAEYWNVLWWEDIVRHEALLNRAVVKGHRLWLVAASREKLRAA